MFSEHQRMRPVLDQARRFDIASNPDPRAIFEAGSAGKWEEDRIVGLQIETSAYALADQMPDKYSNLSIIPKGIKRRSSCNREQDIKWLTKKIAWLFKQADTPEDVGN